MRHPHPLLAVAARVGLAAGVLYLVAGVALILPPLRPGGNWLWTDCWLELETRPFSATVWYYGKLAVSALAGPASWLFAAGLLRLAATGRLAVPGPAPGLTRAARVPAVAGLIAAGVVGGLGVVRWANPGGEDERLAARLTDAVRHGKNYQLELDADFGSTRYSSLKREYGYVPADGSGEQLRLVTTAARMEGRLFVAEVRPAALLFFLAGTVYCLARRSPDAAP